MISFIVIGKNEAKNLTRCFNSIIETISYNKLSKYEILYVDSNSTDNSIIIAKKFMEIKIFKITGVYNSAIARNVGAKETVGDILFFVDGDMEINPLFLKNVLNIKNELKYDFVTGHVKDVIHINNQIINKPRTYDEKFKNTDKILHNCGGIFLIKKILWDKLGGMNTKYRKKQDVDFSMRFIKNGRKIVRKGCLIADHHTIDYYDISRMWKMIFKGDWFYTAVIIRDHINNPYAIFNSIRNNYTSFILLFLIPFYLFYSRISIFILYITILLIRVLINTIRMHNPQKILYFFQRVISQIFKDFEICYALFFFFPCKKKINFKKIK